MTAFSGVINVLVTPFDAAGCIDVTSLRRLVRASIERGVSGLTALGVNGEAALLEPDERDLVTSTVLEAADGAVPIIVGVSDPDRSVAAERAATALSAGAQGAMVALPPRATEGLGHLMAVARSAPELDLVVQDYPASGHEPVTVEALARICVGIPTVRAVKAEDPPTPARIAALKQQVPSVSQLGGLGGADLLNELRAGSAGTMTGFAFPEVLVSIVDAAAAGDWGTAEEVFRGAEFALRWEAQTGVSLGLRKVLLAERGFIDDPRLRIEMSVPADSAANARSLIKKMTERGVVA